MYTYLDFGVRFFHANLTLSNLINKMEAPRDGWDTEILPQSTNITRSKPELLRRVVKRTLLNVLDGGLTKYSLKALRESQRMALKYLVELEISRSEFVRYMGKCAYLAYSYAGFAVNGSEAEARGAGKVAFLSCAYDVASDWRDERDRKWRMKLQSIFETEVPAELAIQGIELYDRDINGQLDNDGLERGVIALKFVLETMGVTEEYSKKTDIEKLGILLQIVDDVLDFEEDQASGDENCLLTERREEHLKALVDGFSNEELISLFKADSVLVTVIKFAREKAGRMLKETA
jgi:hypothetical protein